MAQRSSSEHGDDLKPAKYATATNISCLEQLVLYQLPLLGLLANLLERIRIVVFQLQLVWLVGLLNLVIFDFYLEYRLMRGLGRERLERTGHLLILTLICLFCFGLRPLLLAYLVGNPHWRIVGVAPHVPLVERLTTYYALGLVGFLLLCLVAVLTPALKLQLHLAWRPRWTDVLFVTACVGAVLAGLLWYFAATDGSAGFLAELGQRRFGVSNLAYWLTGGTFALVNACDEELWFRGALLGSLRPFLPARQANLLQAVVFGALHALTALGSLSGLLLTGLFGFVMGWWTCRTRSIWPAVIVHFIADMVIFIYLY